MSKLYFFTNTKHTCNQCNKNIINMYESEFSNIELFGPPYLKCKSCGTMKKTYFKPYSKISTFSKLQYWLKVIPIPLLIWFIAAPSFFLGILNNFIIKNPTNKNIFILIPIFTVFGLIYILRKNIEFINKIEKEHKEISNDYWET